MEIKKQAITHQFDVLLVFMFDRLGRRDDEPPFVVQWFVQQGIEVWSTREGEQRFDTHVDKLLNYIRFWQASGESEKTAIRVRTKHSQMIQEGQWRGGLIPYGYRLEFQGRTNKKSQPVRDLMIDEEEGMVVREIFHLLADEGYGTNRVARYLNDHGIKTKRGSTLWRGTSIRALTGESALDLSVINTMIIKHRSRRDSAAQSMEDARIRLEREQQSSKEAQAQIDEMLSWADCYDNATIATRYMIITRIVERVESRTGRKLHIKFRISLEQFLGEPA